MHKKCRNSRDGVTCELKNLASKDKSAVLEYQKQNPDAFAVGMKEVVDQVVVEGFKVAARGRSGRAVG